MYNACRYALTYYLVPLLQIAAKSGETAAILTVMTAGHGTNFLVDDIELKENFKFMIMLRHCSVLNDVMTEAFSNHHPDISFHHSHPGLVNTKLTRNLPWYIRYPTRLLGAFGMSIEDCGDYSLYGVASHSKEKTGSWSLIQEDGETIEPTKFQTNEACEKSWDWFMKFLDKRGCTELN